MQVVIDHSMLSVERLRKATLDRTRKVAIHCSKLDQTFEDKIFKKYNILIFEHFVS